VPEGVTLYALGTPSLSSAARANQRRYAFAVNTPAYFNFAAGRFHVRQSLPSTDGTPPTATYYLTRRDPAASYVTQSLAVLRVLAAEFGAYPFPSFALVEIPSGLAERAGFAGASAEGAIFTTSQYLDQPFNAAYYGHEIGHQWWGVTIRPTGPRGTWMLSEGMAQYGALRAVEAIAGADAARTFRQREYPGYFGHGGELYFRTVAEGHDAPLADLPIGEEWSRDIADSKGFMVLNALANEMGRDRLRAAAREILRDFRDRRLSWDDFLAVVTRAAGRDMSWFYTQWFDRTGAPELVAERIDSTREVRVRQPRDPYRLTVELAIFGAGCGKRSRITVAASEERVLLPGGCRADSLVVDPDYQILRWTPELRARFDRRD
jgi:aminopeptidase N